MNNDEVVRRKIGMHICNENTFTSWELYFAKVYREKMYQNQLRHYCIPPTLQIVVYHKFGNCNDIKILTVSNGKDSNSVVMLMALIVHPHPHPTPYQPYLIWIFVYLCFFVVCHLTVRPYIVENQDFFLCSVNWYCSWFAAINKSITAAKEFFLNNSKIIWCLSHIFYNNNL